MRDGESLRDRGGEIVVVVRRHGVLVGETPGLARRAPLGTRSSRSRIVDDDFGERELLLLAAQSVGERDHVRGEVPRADLDPERNAAELPVVELEARRGALAVVDLDPHAGGAQLRREIAGRLEDRTRCLAGLPIGTITTSIGASLGRQDQPTIVAVAHDDPADHPRAHAPRGGVRELLHRRSRS